MRRCRIVLWGLAAVVLLATAGCAGETQTAAVATSAKANRATKDEIVQKQHYPETRRVDQVDEYHGAKVADPYRWLEADVRESPEVAEWVQQQQAFARAYLDAIPQRDALERRLTELWNYERYSEPTQEGGKYFYTKNDGLQNQPVLYVAGTYDAEGRVLIDPNEWSNDGTVALASFNPSEDGRYLAYARAEAGSDWQQIYVLDVDTGELLEDHLKWARFTFPVWTKDGAGFFYNRYPEPAEGEQHQTAALNQMVYFHTLGTKQEADQLVYRRPDHADWSFDVTVTDDGQHLVLTIARSTDPQNQVWVRDASAPADAPFQELIGDFENEFRFLGNEGTTFFLLTDLAAPTKRIVAMDIDQPGREHATQIVAAREATLDGAHIFSGRLIAGYMVDVLTEAEVFDLSGKPLGKIERPGYGTMSVFGGDQSNTEAFFAFTSYNTPTRIYRYDVLAGDTQLVREPRVKFDPDDFAVEQVFYHSKDGTRLPMMLAYRKDLRAGSSPTPADPQPTLLYGYGGYSISIVPAFRPEYIAWLEMGGVLAVANLRGGGEYGEEWHLAGKTINKQNVFDDFIAAAEWLIDEGRTTPEKLAIMGGSNGGLLVGAAEVQRPELFGACIPIVGVLDMLRFQEFTAGQFWRDEFGNIEKEEEFKALLAYSPYHNVKEGVKYPATLIMTADTDDRVVPMHSFKFAAALQRAQAGDAPILLRIETRAGHGGGTPVKKQIEIATDRYAFLVKTLGMDMDVKNPQQTSNGR
ncbi:MAG: prolyl oligopeptidase family serine peptidase [Pirellulales bacterium]